MSKAKVMIADDDPFVREMLGTILQESGYDVQTAEDGAEAARKHGEDPGADLIISDMNMPGMSGLELIKKLRAGGSDVPVIILTGNNEISVAIDAMKSGANDYLLKDENIQDTVILSVEKVLEKHNLKMQNIKLMADLAQKNEKLESEKSLAQKVQKNILPKNLGFKGFDVGTFYCPSDQIGGDFFDAWEAGDKVHFLVGDVSGHSTSSALIMAVCKGMLQSLGHAMDNPVEILRTANGMLCEILTDSGMFLSAVYGIYDGGQGSLKIASAGHNPVYLVKGHKVDVIDSTGAVLGWDPDDTWELMNMPLSNGSSIVLYTDGLTEAKNKDGEEFGEERLKGLLPGDASAGGLIEKIYKEVNAYCGGDFPDDMTLFVIKKKE